MKRYSLVVILHIIGICLLSVVIYLLIQKRLWFSALMAFLFLLALAIHLYRMQLIQIRMMRHLAESLRFDDMMLSFRSPYRNRSMETMTLELSLAETDPGTDPRDHELHHPHHIPVGNPKRTRDE